MRILFLVGVLVIAASCGSKDAVIKPVYRNLVEAVYASGSLVPEMEYEVVSDTEGYLIEAKVKEGDTVKTGQLLFSLYNASRQTEEENALRQLKTTEKLSDEKGPGKLELQQRISLQRQRVLNDSLLFARYKNLFQERAISAAQFEKYSLQYETSKRELVVLITQLAHLDISTNLQTLQAANQLAQAKTGIQKGAIKSFTNGIVFNVYKNEGELVRPDQPIALLGSGKMIASVMIDEDDLGRVFTGQEVVLTMDAFPNKVFNGKVNKIYPFLNKVEQAFKADIGFDEALPQNLYGLNVEANLMVSQNKSVLVVPREAVLPGDSLWVKTDSGERKIFFTRGISDGEFVQVLDGVDTSTNILIKPLL